MQNIKSFDTKPYMTIGIIVVNIIVFVLMNLSGSTLDAQYMAAHGAMYPEYIRMASTGGCSLRCLCILD